MPFAEISSERAFFRLPALNVLGISPFHAEVVELVDTLGSGSSGGSPVGVQISPSAPSESIWVDRVICRPVFICKMSYLYLGKRTLL